MVNTGDCGPPDPGSIPGSRPDGQSEYIVFGLLPCGVATGNRRRARAPGQQAGRERGQAEEFRDGEIPSA